MAPRKSVRLLRLIHEEGLDPGERARRRRLLDLVDVLTLMSQGQEIVTADLWPRLRGKKPDARQSERLFGELKQISRELGCDMRRAQTEQERWVIEFDDTVALWDAVNKELDSFVRIQDVNRGPGRKSTPEEVARITALRAGRREVGLCIRCGDRPPQDNTQECRKCRTEQAERQVVRRAYLRKVGICSTCSKARPTGDNVQCDACLRRARRSGDELRSRRITAGLCAKCGNEPLIPGLAYGVACRVASSLTSSTPEVHARRRATIQERKATGLCSFCGKPAAIRKTGKKKGQPATLCTEHLRYMADKRREYLARKKGLE
jgi:hypothetical protein